jgi:phenylacetate-CoA ligase
MNDSEYRTLRENGAIEFATIDHNTILTGRINKELESIINFPRQVREDIQKYQIDQLGKLVDHAFKNIPLCRKKFKNVGFELGDIKSFKDFEQLPFLYKDELIEAFPYDVVKNITDFKYSTRSSGSSGKFVTIAIDLNAIYTDTLQGIRQLVQQSDCDYKKDKVALFIYTCPWWIQDINGEYTLDYLPTTTSPIEALNHIRKTRPSIISTYPTYMQSLCELEINLSDFGVNYIIVHSEQSNKKSRTDMGKMLGVQVRDEYSSEELTRIALECKYGNYHLEEDACYIEIFDAVTGQKK